MQALVYTQHHQMIYRDAPSRPLAAGEVRVRIEAAGICGSDMHAYHGHDARRVPPMILGHEAAGVVVEGDGNGLVGRRVALNPLITCGVCRYCRAGRSNLCPHRTMLGMSRPGTMATEVTIPAEFLHPIPDRLPFSHAALMEPAGCAWHAIELVERAAFWPLPDSKILVIGAGAIGLLLALILRSRGCNEIDLVDTNRLRRQTAESTGVGRVFDPSNRELEADYDLVFDAVGSTGTRQMAVGVAAPGGVILHIGLQSAGGDFDARKITLDEITFLGTYTYTPADLNAVLAALADGRLGDLSWVEARPLADGDRAFTELDAGQIAAGKIVLIP